MDLWSNRLNSPVWMSRKATLARINLSSYSANDLRGPAKIWRSIVQWGRNVRSECVTKSTSNRTSHRAGDRDLTTVLCITRDMIGKLRGRRREEGKEDEIDRKEEGDASAASDTTWQWQTDRQVAGTRAESSSQNDAVSHFLGFY